ncbi:MAG: sodium:solute symporter family transporter [Ruminococcus sp.]
MLIGLLVVPLVAYFLLPGNLTDLISQSGVTGGAGAYLNPLYEWRQTIYFYRDLFPAGMGLGYCGMPHVLVRFMAVKNEKELKKSWAIAIVWDLLSLTAAFAIAVIGRAYLLPVILGRTEPLLLRAYLLRRSARCLPQSLRFPLSADCSSAESLQRSCPQRIPSFW